MRLGVVGGFVTCAAICRNVQADAGRRVLGNSLSGESISTGLAASFFLEFVSALGPGCVKTFLPHH